MFFLFRTLAYAVLIALCAQTMLADDALPMADVDSALGLLGLTVKDFEADRVWAEDDSFLLPVIRTALESPLKAFDVTRAFADVIPQSVSQTGRVAEMLGQIDAAVPDSVRKRIDKQLKDASKHERDPFEPMLTAMTLTEQFRQQAFARLSADERQALLMAMPLWFEDEDIAEDDTLKGALHRALGVAVDTTRKVDGDSVLTLLYRVDRQALSAATYAIARGLELAAGREVKSLSAKSNAKAAGVDGTVLAVRETQLGWCVVGGREANVYHGEFALIIDLGGDDRYLGRAGGAVGEIGQGVAAVLDFEGNDRYEGGHAGLAAGILGFGALVDLKGRDCYQSGAFSQGAAFCGAGLLFDGEGDDIFQAEMFSQSAAVCGVALLVDGVGRDIYDLAMYGQGFASTYACAALVDRSGNDVYRAGGTQTHAPLLPEDYRSFAQGFAIGSRPRGGRRDWAASRSQRQRLL